MQDWSILSNLCSYWGLLKLGTANIVNLTCIGHILDFATIGSFAQQLGRLFLRYSKVGAFVCQVLAVSKREKSELAMLCEQLTEMLFKQTRLLTPWTHCPDWSNSARNCESLQWWRLRTRHSWHRHWMQTGFLACHRGFCKSKSK